MGYYTEQQLDIYYREAVAMQNRQRADQITDINAGFKGGKDADALIKTLRKPLT